MTSGSNMVSIKSAQPIPSVAIVGGGVAGSTAAIHLSEQGLKVSLLEKKADLVDGPPICHLHAGGNLYRDISLTQCMELLRQSIETIRLYPHTLNQRPTVIAVPHSDPGSSQELLARLEVIRTAYQRLVDEDPNNQILGEPKNYYRLYQQEELERLAKQSQPRYPQTMDDWLIPFAQYANLEQLKYPVVAVQEYGWSVFRLAASAALTLNRLDNCQVFTHSTLVHAVFMDDQWHLTYRDQAGIEHSLICDYLINACGYETGTIDDLTTHPRQRFVEFKAAYVSHWPQCHQAWPEVIFHGPRGTPKGMAQLTPYADGMFQLHGMTQDITLFNDGLVTSSSASSQPRLPQYLEQKITQGWSLESLTKRTQQAIDHMSQFIPEFSYAEVAGTPLFGAQQIPGEDASLRAADVTFEANHYARIEIVKGSSALEAAKKIVSTWQLINHVIPSSIEQQHPVSMSLTEQEVEQKAMQLAQKRGYPVALAKVVGGGVS
ncbi:oxidoreductase [Vibrio cincinnatiensis]|uniref:FAD dependent oxidoreductase n=1 Tax=Vibrio cincinnatiensis DSM 19608 TaxID=1123491 RepID=A0A1T4KKC0_VIBCI|nr:FAD-dependent oxidoreductase [Vibrio cincinnatiensis]SJZ42850.1 FAD dependent oxidoreductase [Vibrio cincinnatiensis DSM 19608]SUP48565.1 oxidoreductase [Vibrio cincinnatiensis]